jgi:predicted AlkP superfamily phosphohydrolase/phosphomutase
LGLCRFCLLSAGDLVEIYCSPIQPHPGQPHIPITNPPTWSRELYQALGPFRTMGREVDIFSLGEEIMGDDVMLEDTFKALEEREALTRHILQDGKDDVLISWFGVIDTTQHGYWRFIDPQHPLYSAAGAREYGDAVQRVYQWLDGMTGRLMEAIDQDDTLIIVSDHGGGNFRRTVNFNSWLWNEGYLTIKGVDKDDPKSYEGMQSLPFKEVDWAQTQAYAVGCGKIYINMLGREGQGIVAPGSEAKAVEDELIERLNAWIDPSTGGHVVSQVYRSREVQWGPQMYRAPDLIVGMENGYRIGWDSRDQISTQSPLGDNLNKISGDHISMDYKLVPGTLLSNIKLDLSTEPNIMDVTPTVFEVFGIDIPDDVDGRSLLQVN